METFLRWHGNLTVTDILLLVTVPHRSVEDEGTRKEASGETREAGRGSSQGAERLPEEGAKPDQST